MSNLSLFNEIAKELTYYPETGEFWWNVQTKNKKRNMNKPVGTPTTDGYLCVCYHLRFCSLHRLAYFVMTGEFPAASIDHINGKTDDNRWCNLRVAALSENQQNRKLSKNNKSGYMGVSQDFNQPARWRATIHHHSKQYRLGVFDTPELAYDAYLKKKAELHTFQPVPRKNEDV